MLYILPPPRAPNPPSPWNSILCADGGGSPSRSEGSTWVKRRPPKVRLRELQVPKNVSCDFNCRLSDNNGEVQFGGFYVMWNEEADKTKRFNSRAVLNQ